MSSDNINFVITNLEGKEMKKILVSKSQDQIVVKTDGLVPGTYFYTMYSGKNRLESKKLIVKQ